MASVKKSKTEAGTARTRTTKAATSAKTPKPSGRASTSAKTPEPSRKASTSAKTPKPSPGVAPATAKAAKGPDLEKVALLLARIRKQAKKSGVELAPGASEAKIDAAEKAMGVHFPPELRAYFAAFDGGPPGMRCVRSNVLLSLDAIVARHAELSLALAEGDFFENESHADRGIQPKMWDPGWIPFDASGPRHNHMFDLSPGPGGKVGQVIDFDQDMSVRHKVAPSVFVYLQKAWWSLSPV